MSVYDWNGTTNSKLDRISDWDLSANRNISRGYDWNGSVNSLIYSKTVYLYKDGVTGEVYTGPWVGCGNYHPERTVNKIAMPYGTSVGVFRDSEGILYIDHGTTACGGLRTEQWIPWTSFQGRTCYCDAVIYAKPWGYEDYKYNRYIPYIDCCLWTADSVSVGAVVNARSTAFAGYYTTPPLDSSGAAFDGYVNNNKLYEWRVQLSFKVPSKNGWLFFTMAHGVPCYGQIRTSAIYIK